MPFGGGVCFLSILVLPCNNKKNTNYLRSAQTNSIALKNYPANKEPFLNQLTRVILVHNWHRSTSMCFIVYSHEYTCSACCNEF